MAQSVKDLLSLSSDIQDQIRSVFDARQPFGPSAAKGFRVFPEVANLVFSTENQVWREYLTHPRMIIGRKGSGKTSVLRHTQQSNKYKIVHRVSTSDMIVQCIDTLFKDPTDLHSVSAEYSGKIWGQMINTSLMAEILKKDKLYNFPNIERYFEVSDLISEKRGKNIFSLLRSIPNNDMGGSFGSLLNSIISAILHVRGETGLEYESAVSEMDKYLLNSGVNCVVILDSVEQYPLSDHQFDAVLKGLLRCAGAYGGRHRDIRIGIPAELYFDLRSKSASISKDFDKAMVLHWSPMELLRIIAWRYLVFLSAYDRERLAQFSNIDLADRANVHQVLADFLPEEIQNRSGKREFSIAYVLRHTQLLPRQMIKIFNEAFSTSRPNAPRASHEVTNSLITSVRILESQFCEEICNAFNMKYPYAEALCKTCLPSLPRFFSESYLEKVYREKGKKVLQHYSHVGEVGFGHFRETLFEIGAIGRVKDKSGIYADAEFEYALPGRLYASDLDELCMHPTFSGTYETNTNRSSEHFVYPHLQLYQSVSDMDLRVR